MGFRKDFVWGAATSAYQIEDAVKEDGKPIDVYVDYPTKNASYGISAITGATES